MTEFPEISTKFHTILQKFSDLLLSMGYEKIPGAVGWDVAVFTKPEWNKKYVYGKSYNNFSKTYDDIIATECKSFVIKEVYRHNGIDENASLDILIEVHHSTPPKKSILNPDEFVYNTFDNKTSYTKKLKRINLNVSDKMIQKLVNEGDAQLQSIPLNDLSQYDVKKN